MIFDDVVSIKQHNLKNIITTLRFNDNLTKKNIANLTNLSTATITNLCNELIVKNVISEGSYSTETRIGRIPNLMQFNYNNFFVLALDFQFDNIVGIAILNLRNEILYKSSVIAKADMSVDSILEAVKDVFDKARDELGISDGIIGIGASVPAVYDSNNGLINCSSIPRFSGLPLKKMIMEHFGYPVYVDNCANFRAISAYAENVADNIVCLDISQGVGCGVMIDGSLLHGANGYATEVAHIPIGDMSRRCSACGSYGCVETELNVMTLINCFDDIDKTLPLPVKWVKCVEHTKTASGSVMECFNRIGMLLGQVASILINLFDPNYFYITGMITDVFRFIEKPFWQEIDNRCSQAANAHCRVIVKDFDWSDVYTGISDGLYHRWLP